MNPSEATLAALTPDFPLPDDAPMPKGGADLDDRALLLFSALAQEDGALSHPAYEALLALLPVIWGEQALDAAFQARLHYALLNPPQRPMALAQELAQEAEEARLAPAKLSALVAGFNTLARTLDGREGREYSPLFEAISIAFAEQNVVQRKERLGHRAALPREGLKKLAVLNPMPALKEAMLNMGKAARDVFTSRHIEGSWQADESFLPKKAQNPYDALQGLEKIARTLDLPDVQKELADFRSILHEQPFQVVLLGEGKRGKSTLVNALLGEELSPVRESRAETATVAEFSFAPRPKYTVHFLEDATFGDLEAYLAGEADNTLLARKAELVHGASLRPKGSEEIGSKADIWRYLTQDGPFSPFTAKVSVALPLPALGMGGQLEGTVLVDTPGLNAVDSFHDYLAYSASLKADCLVFVMEAAHPESASELKLLRKLVAAGRAVSVIGVLTGADRLQGNQTEEQVKAQALAFLEEACRGSVGLTVLGTVLLDARQYTAGHKGHASYAEKASHVPQEVAPAWAELMALLRKAREADTNQKMYQLRISARARTLADIVLQEGRGAFQAYKENLPSPQFLELLERHADALMDVIRGQVDQARSVIASAALDIDAWSDTFAHDLDDWQARFVDTLMLEAHTYADSLGLDVTKESAWKRFDEEIAPLVAQQSVEVFFEHQQSIMSMWEEKLTLFHAEMETLSHTSLELLQEHLGELTDICATTAAHDHLLVKVNAYMKNLSLFFAGAGAGVVFGGGLWNALLWGGAAVAILTNPLVLPGAILASAALYALHIVGNPDKRKAAFLARKHKKMEEWAMAMRGQMEEALSTKKAELANMYKNAVSYGFVPSLALLTSETMNVKLYLAVMDKIREDILTLENRVEEYCGILALPEHETEHSSEL